jgi:hypothetical protein
METQLRECFLIVALEPLRRVSGLYLDLEVEMESRKKKPIYI